MSLFSIHDSPGRLPEAIPDRFSWSGFLVTPLHGLHHGLWFMLLVWAIGTAGAVTLGRELGVGAGVVGYLVFALWLGFEASAFRRGALRRRGLDRVGDVVADSAETALASYLRQ